MTKRRAVRSAVICGRRFRVTRPPHIHGGRDEIVLGQTSDPRESGATLSVRLGLDELEELEIWLHECGHAGDWRASEEHVSEWARDVARLLWRLGWRRQA